MPFKKGESPRKKKVEVIKPIEEVIEPTIDVSELSFIDEKLTQEEKNKFTAYVKQLQEVDIIKLIDKRLKESEKPETKEVKEKTPYDNFTNNTLPKDFVICSNDKAIFPREDILDKPVKFISPCAGTSMYCRQTEVGTLIPTPYNRELIFKYEYTRDIPGKKGVSVSEVKHWCLFTTKSKAEVAWIKADPRFGIDIFLSVSEAMKTDDMSILFGIQKMQELNHCGSADLIEIAKKENLLDCIHEDIGTMKSNMLLKMVQREFAAINSGKKSINQQVLEEEIFNVK